MFVRVCWQLSLLLACAGSVVAQTPPPWLGSQEGISEKVLPPWGPIKVGSDEAGVNAQVWGRSYHFSDGSPLAQVTSGGRPLLAGPARLLATVDGRHVAWKHEPVQVVKQTPALVVLQQKASGAGLAVSTRLALEYDGFLRVDWRLEALRPLRLERWGILLDLDDATLVKPEDI
jgi:hypothetical protein